MPPRRPASNICWSERRTGTERSLWAKMRSTKSGPGRWRRLLSILGDEKPSRDSASAPRCVFDAGGGQVHRGRRVTGERGRIARRSTRPPPQGRPAGVGEAEGLGEGFGRVAAQQRRELLGLAVVGVELDDALVERAPQDGGVRVDEFDEAVDGAHELCARQRRVHERELDDRADFAVAGRRTRTG